MRNAVALSSDGNTGDRRRSSDNSGGIGAVWVFTRSGNHMVSAGAEARGHRVGWNALSGKQGRPLWRRQHAHRGWTWRQRECGRPRGSSPRTAGVWNQRGAKLVGTAAVGGASQGQAVALSGDQAKPRWWAGYNDTLGIGATWAYALVGPHDLNADGSSDVVWRNAEGDVSVWLMNGTQITPGPVYRPIPSIWSIVGQRDFNGDGMADLLWRDTSGNTAMWFMNGSSLGSSVAVGNIPTSFTVVASATSTVTAKVTILWRELRWQRVSLAHEWRPGRGERWPRQFAGQPGPWSAPATLTATATSDVLLRDTSGNTALWLMNGTTILSRTSVSATYRTPFLWWGSATSTATVEATSSGGTAAAIRQSG